MIETAKPHEIATTVLYISQFVQLVVLVFIALKVVWKKEGKKEHHQEELEHKMATMENTIEHCVACSNPQFMKSLEDELKILSTKKDETRTRLNEIDLKIQKLELQKLDQSEHNALRMEFRGMEVRLDEIKKLIETLINKLNQVGKI